MRHSALVSVNELNGTLKSLKAESGQLVTDIQKAKSMYESVSNHSQQSLQNFNQHVDAWLDTWLEKQNQLLNKIDDRNRTMLRQIEQLERTQSQSSTALKQRLDDVERMQMDQKNIENKTGPFEKPEFSRHAETNEGNERDPAVESDQPD